METKNVLIKRSTLKSGQRYVITLVNFLLKLARHLNISSLVELLIFLQSVNFKAGNRLLFNFHSDGSNNEWGYKFKVSANITDFFLLFDLFHYALLRLWRWLQC